LTNYYYVLKILSKFNTLARAQERTKSHAEREKEGKEEKRMGKGERGD